MYKRLITVHEKAVVGRKSDRSDVQGNSVYLLQANDNSMQTKYDFGYNTVKHF